MFKYESLDNLGPMQYASSANFTCSASASASEYTATDLMPSSLQARTIRTAISPRLAIKTFFIIYALLTQLLQGIMVDRILLSRHL